MCCIKEVEAMSKTISLNCTVACSRHLPLTSNVTELPHDVSFEDHSKKLLQQILASSKHFSFLLLPALFGLSQLETLVDRNFLEVINLQHHSFFQGTI